jgi:hypothetical protein
VEGLGLAGRPGKNKSGRSLQYSGPHAQKNVQGYTIFCAWGPADRLMPYKSKNSSYADPSFGGRKRKNLE